MTDDPSDYEKGAKLFEDVDAMNEAIGDGWDGPYRSTVPIGNSNSDGCKSHLSNAEALEGYDPGDVLRVMLSNGYGKIEFYSQVGSDNADGSFAFPVAQRRELAVSPRGMLNVWIRGLDVAVEEPSSGSVEEWNGPEICGVSPSSNSSDGCQGSLSNSDLMEGFGPGDEPKVRVAFDGKVVTFETTSYTTDRHFGFPMEYRRELGVSPGDRVAVWVQKAGVGLKSAQ